MQGGCGRWAWPTTPDVILSTNPQFRLFCRHPISRELSEKRLEVHKDITLRQTVAEAHRVRRIKNIELLIVHVA